MNGSFASLRRRLAASGWRLAIGAVALCGSARAADPVYPKIDAAVGYHVEAAWPQRPDHVAPLAAVSGLAVDAQDQVWVFNRGEDPIQVYDRQGKFVRTWGKGHFKIAHHLKIDRAGTVWTTDVGRHVVEQFLPNGERMQMIGTENVSGEDATHLYMPTDIAVTPQGDVFVADGYGNHRVAHFDKQGKFVKAWGSVGAKPGQFNIPHAIAVDHDGRLYVADRNNVRVQVFDQQGKLLDTWSNVIVPWGFEVTRDNEIWICGSSPMRWWKPGQFPYPLGCPPKDQVFMRFTPAGRLQQLWAVPKGTDELERPGECNWLHCIAADSKGDLYVGDIIGKRAQKFVRELAAE